MQRCLVVHILRVHVGLHGLLLGLRVLVEKLNDSLRVLVSDSLEKLVVGFLLELPPVLPGDHIGGGAGSIKLEDMLLSRTFRQNIGL